MVLSPQPQRRPTAHQQKRHGSHQKQTKHYLKTYWPYIPLFVAGAGVNAVLDQAMGSSSLATAASITPVVSRLEWWTGTSQSVAVLVGCIAFVCASVVVGRHAKAWRRVVVQGEHFIVDHHKMDLLLAIIAMGGFLLTRNVPL